ncbi:tissue factor [Labrus bergylta]|uniref:tissue factor n=1 Tax=Labrus bergylta TaxID=56723 RepID=UPI0033134479
MASQKTLLYLGLFLFAEIITAADPNSKAENVRWTSLDFKTMLTWTSKTPQQTYTVKFSRPEGDWYEARNCLGTASECDLSAELKPFNEFYTADILTDNEDHDSDYGHDEFQHTESTPFNPYRDSNISAVEFSVRALSSSTVRLNIIDTLTSVHEGSKQLTIRDIFTKDLKYKIIYTKSGNTGNRENISDSSRAEVTKLDAATSYCFMVAAYIPSRPTSTQLGAWSRQLCEKTHGESSSMHELSMGALVAVIFVLLTVFIIIVTVTALCCKKRQQTEKSLQTTQSQTSAPV